MGGTSEARVVLCVDRSATIQRAFELTLVGSGYTHAGARNMREAMAAAAKQVPVLVIAEVVQADGSGYDLCAALRADARTAQVPVLLLHGQSAAYDAARAASAGATGELIKPWDTDELLARINEVLASGTVTATAPAPARARTKPTARYTLVEPIGSGEVSEVFRGTSEAAQGFRSDVAIKRLRPAFAGDPEFLARYLEQAQAARRLFHDAIVQTFDVGSGGGSYFVVMEHVAGCNLEAVLAWASRRGKPLEIAHAIYIAYQLCKALQAAHDAGVVHGDLRPTNVLLSVHGEVKLVDFGLPAARGEQDAVIDPRSDIVATASLLREMLTGGRKPDPELDAILRRALAHEPAERPDKIIHVGDELADYLHDRRIKVTARDIAALVPQAAQRQRKAATPIDPQLQKDLAQLTSLPAPARKESAPPAPAKAATVLGSPTIKMPPAPAPTRPAPAQPARAAIDFEVAPAAGPPPWIAPDDSLAMGAPPPVAAPGPSPVFDDNVQFTVYRPRAVAPGTWHKLLAFAHLSERPPDAPPDAADPIEQVREEAAALLGKQAADYQDVTQDSGHAVPRMGELTFVPEIAGVTFNPPRASLMWLEPVHRVDFKLQASPALQGKTARGRLTVYLGGIILAEVTLGIRVDAAAKPADARPEPERARAYRKIFASYSHRDIAIVEQFETYAKAVGDEYLRDWVHLRSGQVWTERLCQLIEQADVFQLFWSQNSMRSPFVRQEWEHALSLRRSSFVRPTYWEDPLPRDEAAGLPPTALQELHFQRIGFPTPPAPPEPAPGALPPPAMQPEPLEVKASVPVEAQQASRLPMLIAVVLLLAAAALAYYFLPAT